jgi:L-alanine-DL-glutamate epimerase-like enolase superfamily enzyme
LGDATRNGRELAVASYLAEHLIPCLIGRDPFDIEDIWQYLYRGAYWRRGPVTMSAIAAVDMALWDIKGKALNTPVYNLLGGREESRSTTVKSIVEAKFEFFELSQARREQVGGDNNHFWRNGLNCHPEIPAALIRDLIPRHTNLSLAAMPGFL